MSGGYDPTSTRADAPLIQSQRSVLERRRHHAADVVANSGSPRLRLHNPPLSLASGHFGLGQGSGAHAPDEYYTITSSNPAVQGYDGAVMSFVEYLYELAKLPTGASGAACGTLRGVMNASVIAAMQQAAHEAACLRRASARGLIAA